MNEITIKLIEVPEYLKKSKLFNELLQNNEENQFISIESKYYSEKIDIKNFDSLSNTIEILKHWMVNEYPNDIYE